MANAKPAQKAEDKKPETVETTLPENVTIREDGVRVTELPGGTVREDY